jgi:hypothetical protein
MHQPLTGTAPKFQDAGVGMPTTNIGQLFTRELSR